MSVSLPLNQLSFAVLDLRRSEAWWREGLGFLPSGGERKALRGTSVAQMLQVEGVAMTRWSLVGRNEGCQLKLYQFETPTSQLLPDDYRACDLGYSRCGVWVADFDAALQRLAVLGTQPLGAPVGAAGQRRVCVRNPDGVFVELLEDDPLPAHNRRGRLDAPVALRYVSLSSPDLTKSVNFLTQGLGLQPAEQPLHGPQHEALWQLDGADCLRQVLRSSEESSMLLEVVQYRQPDPAPLPPDYRLCDQRIMAIGLGGAVGSAKALALLAQAEVTGARRNAAPLDKGSSGCVYLRDPLGFTQEIIWSKPGPGQRSLGFEPSDPAQRPLLDDRMASAVVSIAAPCEKVFAVISDHAGITDWAGLGIVSLDKPGHPDPAGRHAVRQINGPMGMLREQITEVLPNRLCRYRIIEGGPFIGHWGEVRLREEGGVTSVEWIIRFRSRIPGLGWLFERVLQHKLGQVLTALRQRVEGD